MLFSSFAALGSSVAALVSASSYLLDVLMLDAWGIHEVLFCLWENSCRILKGCLLQHEGVLSFCCSFSWNGLVIFCFVLSFKIFVVFTFWLHVLSLLAFFLHANHNPLEWWSFEGLILLSGLLPNPELETSVLSLWYASFPYLLYEIQ